MSSRDPEEVVYVPDLDDDFKGEEILKFFGHGNTNLVDVDRNVDNFLPFLILFNNFQNFGNFSSFFGHFQSSFLKFRQFSKCLVIFCMLLYLVVFLGNFC